MKRTLIVIDMQNDFVTGSLGTPEAQAIVPNVKRKIDEYQARGDKIIFTRDSHNANYLHSLEGKHLPVEHCIVGTKGWCVVDELNNPSCEHVDKKTFGYAFWGDDYYFEEIEIVGVCTDVCVISNALILKATFRTFDITVDASCCAGTTTEKHEAALEVMKSCQINVIGE